MRSLLMRVRLQRSPYKGVIYKIPYHDCDQVYIGETRRPLITRIKEHQRHCKYGGTDESAVALHTRTNNNCIDWESSSVIDTEDRLLFFDPPLQKFLGCMVMVEMPGMYPSLGFLQQDPKEKCFNYT